MHNAGCFRMRRLLAMWRLHGEKRQPQSKLRTISGGGHVNFLREFRLGIEMIAVE